MTLFLGDDIQKKKKNTYLCKNNEKSTLYIDFRVRILVIKLIQTIFSNVIFNIC